jgi:ribosomal protein S18 acetylase RimI-like enzyme
MVPLIPLPAPIVSDTLHVEDEEIVALLHTVYVGEGFTDVLVADSLFAPANVRVRGTLFSARDRYTQALLGMIVLVSPGASAKQIATESEAELHLLAVTPLARGFGIGRALVEATLERATVKGWRRVVLSTQATMHSAQRLYRSCGFCRMPERDWGRQGHRFLAFGRDNGC